MHPLLYYKKLGQRDHSYIILHAIPPILTLRSVPFHGQLSPLQVKSITSLEGEGHMIVQCCFAADTSQGQKFNMNVRM
jgi:hypothetical protein